MKKLLLGLMIIETMTALMSVSSMAQTSVKNLRTADQNIRLNFVSELRSKYSKDASLIEVKEIAETSKELVKLFQDTNEDTWLTRSAQSLLDLSTTHLAKKSDPDSVVLLSYFSQLEGEVSQYDVLEYWTIKSSELNDKKSLLELLSFFAQAKLMVENSAKYPGYFAKILQSSIDSIKSKLFQ